MIFLRENGMPVLSQRQVTESDRELFFLQREAERMRKILRERRPAPKAKSQERTIEEELSRWMDEAERVLERLRRKRRRVGLRG
ncbi:TPA: hypothetical protein EYP13_04700 [Candidatus Micrarchaeota archaeon]|nr:hypothetical protein [Candidatus Micrarchaeota archaeon]